MGALPTGGVVVNVEIRGGREMERKLVDTRARGEHAFQAAAFMLEQDAMTAVLPHVPVDKGNLLGARAILRSWPIESGFYDAKAAAVHELPSAHRRGSWKYMQIGRAEVMHGGAAAHLARHFERAFALGLTLASAPAVHPEVAQEGTMHTSAGRRERPRLTQRRRPRAAKRRR